MDHNLRLIQHNWIVLAYNFKVVILMLIIRESSICAISAYHFISVLSLLLPYNYHFISVITEYQL
jgi:hypothetical protein